MCDGNKRRGTISEAMENWRQPLPLAWKVRLAVRNNLRKIRMRSDCCGNYGEPGC
jgi:hypothetical protein